MHTFIITDVVHTLLFVILVHCMIRLCGVLKFTPQKKVHFLISFYCLILVCWMTIVFSLVHFIIHKIVNTVLSYIIHISTVSSDRLTLMPPNPSADRVQLANVCHLFDAKFVHLFVLHHVAHITLGEVLFRIITSQFSLGIQFLRLMMPVWHHQPVKAY